MIDLRGHGGYGCCGETNWGEGREGPPMSEMKRDEVCPGDRAVPRDRDVDNGAVLHLLQGRFPELLALYAFGSRVTGGATAESDLDLAILVTPTRTSASWRHWRVMIGTSTMSLLFFILSWSVRKK